MSEHSSSHHPGHEISLDECHVTGLKRFTKYAITVQAFNSKGTGPSAEMIQVQTLENDPPPPPVLKVSTVSTSSIHLSWSLPSPTSIPSPSDPVSDSLSSPTSGQSISDQSVDPNPITGFILHVKKPGSEVSTPVIGSSGQNGHNGQSLSSDWEEIRLPGDRTAFSFDRLACGSKYQYYLTAFNSVGKSDPSEVLSTKTEGTGPVAPDKSSLVTVNTTAAHIYLDSWHDGGCPIQSFEVEHKARKSTRSKWDSLRVFPASGPSSKSVILTDLLPSTIYDLKIIATNQAGSTEAQYSFTTASMLRASGGGAIIGMNHEQIASNNLVQFDLTLLLPTTVSLVMIIVLIFIARICLMKKRQLNNSQLYGTASVYGSQAMYESTKSTSGGAGGESVCLTGLGPTCTLKAKLGGNNGLHSGGGDTNSSNNYPNPYELTKLNGNNADQRHHAALSQTTPLKPVSFNLLITN